MVIPSTILLICVTQCGELLICLSRVTRGGYASGLWPERTTLCCARYARSVHGNNGQWAHTYVGAHCISNTLVDLVLC
jgi:hypothetical protein